MKKLSGDWGFTDLFWPGRPLAEHKYAGEDLGKLHAQGILLYDPSTMPAPLLKVHQQLTARWTAVTGPSRSSATGTG